MPSRIGAASGPVIQFGLPFRPDIEGLRAISIGLVVAFHAKLPFASGGFVGVDVFFVLSGYLITRLLRAEFHTTGQIKIFSFYARRTRRLLPAMAGMLLVTIVSAATLCSQVEQIRISSTALATAVYASNFIFAHRAADYWGTSTATDPLLHTWSLSIEEQFYLFWPIFIFALLKRSNRVLPWAILVGSLASLLLSIHLTVHFQPYAFFLPTSRAWEFGAGALLAAIDGGAMRLHAASRKALVTLGLLAILGPAIAFDDSTTFPGFAALLPVAGTILCLRAGEIPGNPTVFDRFLQAKAIQYLGRISYSWYLWHWPLLVFGEAVFGPPSIVSTTIQIVTSLGLAVLSFHWIESPIRHSSYMRHPARSLAGAAVLTLVSVTSAGIWWALAQVASNETDRQILAARKDLASIFRQPGGCHVHFEETNAVGCLFGEEPGGFKAVLVGDSHAGSWFPPLLEIAKEQSWTLLSLTKSACPMVEVEVAPPEVGRRYDECTTWRRDAIKRIESFAPDLVVVANATGRYAANESSKPSTADWLVGIDRVLSELSETSKRVVVLRDVPHFGFDALTCLSRERWRAGQPTACAADFESAYKFDRHELEESTASHLPNVQFIDLSSAFCQNGTCSAVIDGKIAFRDTDHLTASFATGLKPVLERALLRALADGSQ